MQLVILWEGATNKERVADARRQGETGPRELTGKEKLLLRRGIGRGDEGSASTPPR